jgi:hypothetical protein
VSTATYHCLNGADAPVDVVDVTSNEVERYRDTHCPVLCPALKDGKVVYGAYWWHESSADGHGNGVSSYYLATKRERYSTTPGYGAELESIHGAFFQRS